MISSFNARIKPPMIGGFPAYFVYSAVTCAITLWLFLMLWGQIFLQIIMASIFISALLFGIYVLRHHHDWLLLAAKRAARFEADSRLYRLDV